MKTKIILLKILSQLILTLLFFASCNSRPKKNNYKIYNAENINRIPVYGVKLKEFKFENIQYAINSESPNTILVAMRGTRMQFASLFSQYGYSNERNLVATHHNYRNKKINVPDLFLPNGKEVLVFEGKIIEERITVTYYFVTPLNKSELGTIYIHHFQS
jgi:hypothetical protein